MKSAKGFPKVLIGHGERYLRTETRILQRIWYGSHEHSGLAWAAIFEEVSEYKDMHTVGKKGMPEKMQSLYFFRITGHRVL